MLSLLLVSQLAFASTQLSPGGSYPVKKEIQDAGVAPKALESFYSEMEMDFASFDAGDASGEPLMSTHTEQLTKMRKLPKLDPKDPLFPKDGFNDRMEMTYERLVNLSKVRVPGLPKPFETRSDVGVLLSSKPLVIRGDGKEAKTIDNLEQIKADALAKSGDPMTRASVSTLLNESMLLKMGAAVGQDNSCLGNFVGKKPGAKWNFSRVEMEVKLDYECSFEGWSEKGGNKIAVIKIHSGKQRTMRKQPNGVPGMAETEADGMIYFEPSTQESLLKMENNITVEPAEDEVNRLKAKGQQVPRNKSVMKNWNHIYGL